MSSLYVVPTPIGNVRDITLRAIETLKECPIILAEDTRVTRKLLGHLDIDYTDKKFISFFDHNETKRIPEIIELLSTGLDIALVSDAGTPVINDPGYKLIRTVSRDHPMHKVHIFPGANSITTALVASSLPPDKFTFLGYLPRKQGDRKRLFGAIKKSSIKSTYIAFESKHRLKSVLETMRDIFGSDINVSICRELTKLHESIHIGKLKKILNNLENGKIQLKGEIVIVFNLNGQKTLGKNKKSS